MAFKNSFRVWDDDFEMGHFTPEEIKKADAKVALIGEIMKAKHDGMTYQDAAIQVFTKNPEIAEKHLQAAIDGEDAEEISRIKSWIETARKQKTTISNMAYWGALIDNAEKAAESGKNLDVVIQLVSTALKILKSAVPTVPTMK